ncbi:MAG: hypothetical protein ACP5E4_04015 [Candidatus Aenigmatarchaeota archaeon]
MRVATKGGLPKQGPSESEEERKVLPVYFSLKNNGIEGNGGRHRSSEANFYLRPDIYRLAGELAEREGADFFTKFYAETEPERISPCAAARRYEEPMNIIMRQTDYMLDYVAQAAQEQNYSGIRLLRVFPLNFIG